MIVTFDTTILVRATARADGPARRAVDTIIEHPNHVLALSPYIISEVGKVLSYPRLQELYQLTPDDIHNHLRFLCSVARIVEPAAGFPSYSPIRMMTLSFTLRSRQTPKFCAPRIGISTTAMYWHSAPHVVSG
jgi:hypothetical protein